MKCASCDCILTDFEATRKSPFTKQYLDLCNHCFSSIRDDMYVLERHDLEHDDGMTNNPVDNEDNQ
jgi:hypothetical protein